MWPRRPSAATEDACSQIDGPGRGIFFYPNGDVYVGQVAKSLNDEPGQLFSQPGLLRRGLAGHCVGSARGAVPSRASSSSSRAGSFDCSEGSDHAPPPVVELAANKTTPFGPGRRQRPRGLSRDGSWREVDNYTPQREGWGVHLHGQEKYEGEWQDDQWQGLGAVGARMGDRYIGRFARGQRAGGLTVARTGVLYVDRWEAGKLVDSRPAFGVHTAESRSSSSSSSSSRASNASAGRGGVEDDICTNASAEDLSNLRLMDTWSPRQVSGLVHCLGLGAAIAAKLRAHRVNGQAFAMLASPAAATFLRTIITAGNDAGKASRRLLVLAVELFLRMRQRLRMPTMSVDKVQDDFHPLEIREGQISFGDVVGEGGYGHVYKARWMHADVAAKAFRNKNNSDQPPRDFGAELRVLQALRHPNITRLIGYCTKPKYIIVTEFVAGHSLYDQLHGNRPCPDWTLSRVVCVAREICLGLAYMHSRDIVHCDLKSGNILFSGVHEVKICDFGLSHLLSEAGDAVKDSGGIAIGCVGTYNWMAPEVLRGEEYSKAADVYSCGMLLWEMIARKVPFQGFSCLQVTALVGYGRRRPCTPAGCPESLRRILCSVLRPRRSSRQSSQKLVEVLEPLHRSAVIDVEESLWTFFAG